jgi:hypothetical protein
MPLLTIFFASLLSCAQPVAGLGRERRPVLREAVDAAALLEGAEQLRIERLRVEMGRLDHPVQRLDHTLVDPAADHARIDVEHVGRVVSSEPGGHRLGVVAVDDLPGDVDALFRTHCAVERVRHLGIERVLVRSRRPAGEGDVGDLLCLVPCLGRCGDHDHDQHHQAKDSR